MPNKCNDASTQANCDTTCAPVTLPAQDACRGYSCDGKFWSSETLFQAAAKLEPFDMPLQGIYLGSNIWSPVTCVSDMARHVQRIQEASFDYPIILDEDGFIMDGWHRVTKAIIEKRPTIRAVRFVNNPAPTSDVPTKDSKASGN